MTDHEGCVALNMVPGVGFKRFSRLEQAFGSAGAVLGRSVEEYLSVEGVGPKVAEALAAFSPETLEKELAAAEAGGVKLLTPADDDYPQVLRELYDPPICLYLRGELPEFPDRAVAIVGSRRISSYGERMAHALASDAVAAGFTVVSGLAFGADSAAHAAAVENAGITVAVLGGGFRHIHPKENVPLARRIVETGGAIISEFPLDFPVSRQTFPRRNRIVAGLCRGTIVVEAGLESGAMITARLAMENGREVFAVPGRADNPQAKGCHKLIKEGAALIEDFSDVLEAFHFGLLPGMEPEAEAAAALPPELQAIRDLLQNGDASLEEMQHALDCDPGELLSRLMQLEMRLLVRRNPDQRYALVR